MADMILLEELQDFLVEEDIAQLPGEDASATLASVWWNPNDGAPAPRAVDAGGIEYATITLVDILAALGDDTAPWIEKSFIDVIVRSRDERVAILVQRSIRDLLAPLDILGGRKQWTMNNLLVERSDLWRGEQPLNSRSPNTYDRSQAFLFECRRKSLAGIPYVP